MNVSRRRFLQFAGTSFAVFAASPAAAFGRPKHDPKKLIVDFAMNQPPLYGKSLAEIFMPEQREMNRRLVESIDIYKHNYGEIHAIPPQIWADSAPLLEEQLKATIRECWKNGGDPTVIRVGPWASSVISMERS